jgi:hypothetical protein
VVRELKIDTAFAWRFVASGVIDPTGNYEGSCHLYSPPTVSSSATIVVAPNLAPFNTGNVYVGEFTPDAIGPWLIACYDAGGNLVYAQEFDCVAFTMQERLKYVSGTTAGKCSGAGTGTETFFDLDDTTVVIEATVDGDGNRTEVIKDPA